MNEYERELAKWPMTALVVVCLTMLLGLSVVWAGEKGVAHEYTTAAVEVAKVVMGGF